MKHPRRARPLWLLALAATAYLAMMYLLDLSTGSPLLDGGIGVLLGLFICSRPAGNAVDLMFYQRGEFHRLTSELSGIGWLALNLFVLFLGWLVIVYGATRFAAS